MGRWFSPSRDRRDGRRGSDHTADELQYTTPRGSFPVGIVDDVGERIKIPEENRTKWYPHIYENRPERQPFGESKPLFDDYETLEGEQLWEFPLTKPGHRAFKYDQSYARLDQVLKTRTRKARDLWKNPPNDPGPVRGVMPVHDDEDDDGRRRRRPPIGVLYHPEGDTGGFRRARLEPLDRKSRATLHRWEDDMGFGPMRLRRAETWPPRDEEAEDLTTYETRHEAYAPQERRYYDPHYQPPPRPRHRP